MLRRMDVSSMLDRAAFVLIAAIDRLGAHVRGRKLLAFLGLGGLLDAAVGLSGGNERMFLRVVILVLLVVVVIIARALVVRLREPEIRENALAAWRHFRTRG